MPLNKNAKFLKMQDAGLFKLPPQAKVVHAMLADELKYGDHVKFTVECSGMTEKFWCNFMHLDEDGGIHCKVDNYLLLTHLHGIADKEILVVDRAFLCAAITE